MRKVIRDESFLQEEASTDNSAEVFRLRALHKKIKNKERNLQRLRSKAHHQHHDEEEIKPELNMQVQQMSDMKLELGTSVQQKQGSEFVEVLNEVDKEFSEEGALS